MLVPPDPAPTTRSPMTKLKYLIGNTVASGTVSLVVPTAPFQPDLQGLLPSKNLESLYHVIPSFTFESTRTLNSWKFVLHILKNRLSQQYYHISIIYDFRSQSTFILNRGLLLDIGLPYHDEQTGRTHRARYIFCNNSLYGVRVDTSDPKNAWPRHFNCMRSLPQQLLPQAIQKEYLVGQFYLELSNSTIGLVFASELRQHGLIFQYLNHAFDILSVTDQNHDLKNPYIYTMLQEAERNNIIVIYTNCQDLLAEPPAIGGALIAQKSNWLYSRQMSLALNSVLSLKIDFRPSRENNQQIALSQWKGHPSSLHGLKISHLFNKHHSLQPSASAGRMQLEDGEIPSNPDTVIMRMIPEIQVFKCKLWTYFIRLGKSPILCQWKDHWKNVFLLCLMRLVCEDLLRYLTEEQLKDIFPRLQDTKISLKSLFSEITLVYCHQQELIIDQLDILSFAKPTLGSNFVQIPSCSNKASQIKTTLDTLSSILQERSQPNRLILFTQNPKQIQVLKFLNLMVQGDCSEQTIYMCFDLFDSKTLNHVQFFESLALKQRNPEKNLEVFSKISQRYYQNLNVTDQTGIYFKSLKIQELVSKYSQSFSAPEFLKQLRKRPGYNELFEQDLLEYYIPKLLASPLNLQNSLSKHFLCQNPEQVRLHQPRKPNSSKTNLLADPDVYIQQIEATRGSFITCHTCLSAVPKDTAISCCNTSCLLSFCMKCLHQKFKRFEEIKRNKKLEDCPVCVKECQCNYCKQEVFLEAGSTHYKRKVTFKERCHCCKKQVEISTKCSNSSCLLAFCLKCSKQGTQNTTNNLNSNDVNWICLVCNKKCICADCESKKRLHSLTFKKTPYTKTTATPSTNIKAPGSGEQQENQKHTMLALKIPSKGFKLHTEEYEEKVHKEESKTRELEKNPEPASKIQIQKIQGNAPVTRVTSNMQLETTSSNTTSVSKPNPVNPPLPASRNKSSQFDFQDEISTEQQISRDVNQPMNIVHRFDKEVQPVQEKTRPTDTHIEKSNSSLAYYGYPPKNPYMPPPPPPSHYPYSLQTRPGPPPSLIPNPSSPQFSFGYGGPASTVQKSPPSFQTNYATIPSPTPPAFHQPPRNAPNPPLQPKKESSLERPMTRKQRIQMNEKMMGNNRETFESTQNVTGATFAIQNKPKGMNKSFKGPYSNNYARKY